MVVEREFQAVFFLPLTLPPKLFFWGADGAATGAVERCGLRPGSSRRDPQWESCWENLTKLLAGGHVKAPHWTKPREISALTWARGVLLAPYKQGHIVIILWAGASLQLASNACTVTVKLG